MLLRQLGKLTSTVDGFVSQAHRNHIRRSYHASTVKVTGENDSASQKDQQPLSLDSMSAEEIISTLEAEKNAIKGSHMVMALNTISNEYKGLSRTVEEKHLIRKFIPILVQNKNKLSGQQALDIVKMLDQLRVARNSKIYSAILQHILHSISDLSLKGYCEISDIIRDETVDHGLRGNLQAAIEGKLLVKLSMNFDKNDSEFYQCALHLILQNPQLPDQNNLFQILMKNLCDSDDIIPLDNAILIYKSLHLLEYSQLKVDALHKVQSDLAEQAHLFNRNQIKEMIDLLFEQEKNKQLEDCYNEKFVNALAKRVVDGRFEGGLALFVSVRLTQLRHKSPELLEYNVSVNMRECRALGMEKSKRIMWTLAEHLCKTRHKTIFWDELKDSMLINAPEFCQTPKDFVYFASRVIAMDWFPNPMLEKIFDGSFKPSALNPASWIFCRMYQMLKLDASYDGPMPTDSQIADLRLLMQKCHCVRKNRPFPHLIYLLEGIKDPACIRIDIKTQFFHELDYVVGFYQDGTPAPISVNLSNNESPDGIRYIEDLSVPPSAKLVIVEFLHSALYFRNTPELLGYRLPAVMAVERLPYPVVFVNGRTWINLPADEKTSFIMDAIRSKLKSCH